MTPAQNAVVQHALARGYLRPEQVQEALRLTQQGQPNDRDLLSVLRARYLQPEQVEELGRVYQHALGDELAQSAGTIVSIANIVNEEEAHDEP